MLTKLIQLAASLRIAIKQIDRVTHDYDHAHRGYIARMQGLINLHETGGLTDEEFIENVNKAFYEYFKTTTLKNDPK